jgi:hypothetical protein
MGRALVAACTLGTLLAAAPAAQGAYLERQVRSFDGWTRAAYWEMVPLVPAPLAQDVTYRAHGDPSAAAGDPPTAVRIEVTDRDDPMEADETGGCVAVRFYGTCVGSGYQAMHVSLWGRAKFRDTADSAPIPLGVLINGGDGGQATFASAAAITFTGGPGPDTVALADTTAGGAWINSNGGDDTIDVRNGKADAVDCGAGTDGVQADPADDVRPDCESVSR